MVVGPRLRATACTHVGTRTRMQRVRCEERCHSVPSPLAGEGQGGGYNKHSGCFHPMSDKCWSKTSDFQESTRSKSVARCALSPPPSLSLPRKGGGNRVARLFATFPPRNLRCVHSLALSRGRTERELPLCQQHDPRGAECHDQQNERGRGEQREPDQDLVDERLHQAVGDPQHHIGPSQSGIET